MPADPRRTSFLAPETAAPHMASKLLALASSIGCRPANAFFISSARFGADILLNSSLVRCAWPATRFMSGSSWTHSRFTMVTCDLSASISDASRAICAAGSWPAFPIAVSWFVKSVISLSDPPTAVFTNEKVSRNTSWYSSASPGSLAAAAAIISSVWSASPSAVWKSVDWPSAAKKPAIWILFCSNALPMSATCFTTSPVTRAVSAVPMERIFSFAASACRSSAWSPFGSTSNPRATKKLSMMLALICGDSRRGRSSSA